MLGEACHVGHSPEWLGTAQLNQGCKSSLIGANRSVGGVSSVGVVTPGSVPRFTVVPVFAEFDALGFVEGEVMSTEPVEGFTAGAMKSFSVGTLPGFAALQFATSCEVIGFVAS